MITLNRFFILFSVTLTTFFIFCTKSESEEVITPEPEPPKNETPVVSTPQAIDVVNLLKTKSTQIKSILSESTQKLSEGITLVNLKYVNAQDKNMSIHVIVADFGYKYVTAQVLNPYNTNDKRFQILPDMVRANEEAGTKIHAAVNGDYFSWSNMETTGPFIYDGIVRKANPANSTRPSFGITRTGIPVFLNAPSGYSTVFSYGDNLLRHLVGGNQWFIYNGQKVTITDTTVEPRTSIGMREDKKVISIVVDGRSASHSNGMSYVQLQEVYDALGAKYAFNLDGGGSTIAVVRKENEASWEVVNKPSESGPYRALANGIGFVYTN